MNDRRLNWTLAALLGADSLILATQAAAHLGELASFASLAAAVLCAAGAVASVLLTERRSAPGPHKEQIFLPAPWTVRSSADGSLVYLVDADETPVTEPTPLYAHDAFWLVADSVNRRAGITRPGRPR